jgi:protein phosphatase PTC7
LKGLAKKLAKIASERGPKKYGRSPFGMKAQEWGIKHKGGKLDDITVVVA